SLKGGVDSVRSQLQALGLEPRAPVCGLTEFDVAFETRARALWDTAALLLGYARMRARLEDSAERLGLLDPREAMVESFLLGGQAIRQLVLDPLLPEPILPAGELTKLVDAMRHYDRLGRDCWKAFMMA